MSSYEVVLRSPSPPDFDVPKRRGEFFGNFNCFVEILGVNKNNRQVVPGLARMVHRSRAAALAHAHARGRRHRMQGPASRNFSVRVELLR